MNSYKIALAGNPNCGKTTIFNQLTGSRQRIGNWPGVTVEKKEGHVKFQEKDFYFVDLPGIYSLTADSEDEVVSRDYLLSNDADIILNVVDATNLERNLFLTTQLLEMNLPVILVLNMKDLAQKRHISIDVDHLKRHLGVEVLYVAGTDLSEVKEIFPAIVSSDRKPNSSFSVSYPNEIESVITKYIPSVVSLPEFNDNTSGRWSILKLLEKDPLFTKKAEKSKDFPYSEFVSDLSSVEKILKDPSDVVISDYRYGFVHGVSRDVQKMRSAKETFTDSIDRFVMNKFLGIPIFLGVMFLVFFVAIQIGGVFIDFFDIFMSTIFVDGLGSLLSNIGAPAWIKVLLADGIGSGLTTVATFIPVIFFMFLMLSILEDSGYMARAAFVMDRFMRWIGLPGKSFVPMLVGFGCTVPAILSTRTLEEKRDRMMTTFMVPLMSCGARLPVYALFANAFFKNHAGLIVFSIYFAGVMLAVLTGLLLKKTIFKGEVSHFVMELPPYHTPRMKHILLHTWMRLKTFIYRAGVVMIIAVSILSVLNSIKFEDKKVVFGAEQQGSSLLEYAGKAVTPVFTPMGIEKDNWPASVGFFTGVFAKEAVIATVDSLYSQIYASNELATLQEEEEFSFWGGIAEAFIAIPEGFAGLVGIGSDDSQQEGSNDLAARLQDNFTPASAYAYLLFILIYFPCIAAFVVAVKQLGRLYGWLMGFYLTSTAWAVSTLFFQIAEGHNWIWILVALAVLGLEFLIFYLIGKKSKLFKVEEID